MVGDAHPAPAGRSKMVDDDKYSINLKTRFQPLEIIDIPTLVDESDNPWRNYSLSKVNDCVVRLGIIEGEFHWHKHDDEDEFFYVVDGQLLIDIKDETIELNPQQAYMIPKGVLHRTRAPQRTVILMVEGRTVTPTGD